MRRAHAPGIIIPTLAVVGLGCIWWATRDTSEPQAEATITRTAPASRALGPRWQPDQVYRYSMHYQAQEEVALKSVSADDRPTLLPEIGTELAGTLSVQRLATPPDAPIRLRWRLTSLKTLNLKLPGHQPGFEAEAIEGATIEVTLNDQGGLQTLHTDPEAHETGQMVMKRLVEELQLSPPGQNASVSVEGRRWTTLEAGPHGRAQSQYRAAHKGAGVQMTRRREQYSSLRNLPWLSDVDAVQQRLHHETTASLNRAGELVQMTGAEALLVKRGPDGSKIYGADSAFDLTLTSVESLTSPAPAEGLVASNPGAFLDSPSATRRALEDQVDGLSIDHLMSYIRGFNPHKLPPNHARLIWRAVGLLQLHPQLCAQLETLFAEPEMDRFNRLFLMELLAHADHDTAQASLRRLVEHPAVREAPGLYQHAVQRMAFVPHPDSETTDYLVAALDQEDETDRMAAAYTLGTASSKMADEDLRAVAEEKLLGLLDQAETVEDQAHLLRAVGNTGNPDLLPVFSRASESEDWQVRAAAAAALWKTRAPEARALLIASLGDPESSVQGAGLSALANHPADAETLAGLGDQILTGRLHPRHYNRASNMVDSISDPEMRAEVLRHMIIHTQGNPSLVSRLTTMLPEG